MNHYETDRETAARYSASLLTRLEKEIGLMPGLFGVMAESPAIMKAYASIENLYRETSLSPEEQAAVLLTASVENDCNFCVAAHATLMRQKLGMDEEIISQIKERQTLDDDRLNALCLFTRAVVRRQGYVEEGALRIFLEAGYTKSSVMDVLLGITMVTLTNYTNNILTTPLDRAFRLEQWNTDSQQAI